MLSRSLNLIFRAFLTVLVLSASCGVAGAATLTVGPGQGYATIQSAVDAATTGDVVLVHPGTYYESVHFNGKDIVVRSTDPASTATVATTVIDGGDSNPVIVFEGSESVSCMLWGLTITHGRNNGPGGGIVGGGCRANIRECVIAENTAVDFGGGIYECHGVIEQNSIMGNRVSYRNNYAGGGGLAYCDGLIQANLISQNYAELGGGLLACLGTIRGNVISDNRSSVLDGGGAAMCRLLEYNVITRNYANGVGGGLFNCRIVRHNQITENHARGYGGGFGYESNTNLADPSIGTPTHIHDNIITSNTARNDGYGAAAGSGGAFYISTRVLIERNLISGNSAVELGGAFFSGRAMTIRDNTIINNEAGYSGGAFAFAQGTIEFNTIAGNRVTGSYPYKRHDFFRRGWGIS